MLWMPTGTGSSGAEAHRGLGVCERGTQLPELRAQVCTGADEHAVVAVVLEPARQYVVRREPPALQRVHARERGACRRELRIELERTPCVVLRGAHRVRTGQAERDQLIVGSGAIAPCACKARIERERLVVELDG